MEKDGEIRGSPVVGAAVCDWMRVPIGGVCAIDGRTWVSWSLFVGNQGNAHAWLSSKTDYLLLGVADAPSAN